MTPDIPLRLELLRRLVNPGPAVASGEPVPAPALPGDRLRAVSLPRAAFASDRPLADVIVRRRSGALVPGGELGAADLGALLADLASSLPAPLADPPPGICVLAFAVETLSPGSYAYDPGAHALLPIGPADREAVRRDVFLQSGHSDGAAILLLVAPMAAWLHAAGDRGYRAAALQAGWLTDRLYLRAEALGLRYTASAGFAPGAADGMLGLDGRAHTTLFSMIVGPG